MTPASRPQRIHIVGPQRSGTTLMQALFGTCFAIDGVTTREERLWRGVPRDESILVTKCPGDEGLAPILLRLDRHLWFVFMLRDPRDLIVSEHGKEPGRYYATLRAWRTAMRVHDALKNHPRFVVVRYEDLVRSPDRVQDALIARMSFLRPIIPFSQYHAHVSTGAAESRQFHLAMRGIRPVTDESIGAWRAHVPRVKAQLASHRGVERKLIELGYETDDAWLEALGDAAPDHQQSMVSDVVPLRKIPRIVFRRATGSVRYLARRYLHLKF